MTTVAEIKQKITEAINAERTRLTALRAQQEGDGAAKVAATKADMKNLTKALQNIDNVDLRAQLMEVCQARLDQAVEEGEALKIQSNGDIDALGYALESIQALTPISFGVTNDTDAVASDVAKATASNALAKKQTSVIGRMSWRLIALRDAFLRTQAVIEQIRL